MSRMMTEFGKLWFFGAGKSEMVPAAFCLLFSYVFGLSPFSLLRGES